jgi:ABC-type transporter Mla subunit MlaD
MRKAIVPAIALVAATCLAFLYHEKSGYHLTLRAYFSHIQNVQTGMPVCVDGVQVGTVASVKVRPELGNRPVEVVLTLSTPYKLNIPQGSTAQVLEPGILRAKVVDIDTREAQGPPAVNGGAIEGQESRDDQAAHALGIAVKALIDQAKTRSKPPNSQPPVAGKPQ